MISDIRGSSGTSDDTWEDFDLKCDRDCEDDADADNWEEAEDGLVLRVEDERSGEPE